jgi:hypothetical protein
MPARWKPEKEAELVRWVNSGKYTYLEIAKKMGLNKNQIATKANALGLKNPTYRKRITKHAHLRERVMTYFLDHSWEETRLRFRLTASELKSLFTVGYRDPTLAHLRKDTRRKDSWTLDEMLFCIRHAGIRERSWIAKRLNRGCATNIKERFQKWGASTKFLNGMPMSWVIQLWGSEFSDRRIRTKAGPPGIWRFQLLPWHDCLVLSKKYPTDETIRSGIRAMVKFQEFIFKTKSSSVIRRTLSEALEEGERQ